MGKESVSETVYPTSRALTAGEAAKSIWDHWRFEHAELYVLDVVWNEDPCQVNTGNAAENLAHLRRTARNLVDLVVPVRGFAAAKRAARFSQADRLG